MPKSWTLHLWSFSSLLNTVLMQNSLLFQHIMERDFGWLHRWDANYRSKTETRTPWRLVLLIREYLKLYQLLLFNFYIRIHCKNFNSQSNTLKEGWIRLFPSIFIAFPTLSVITHVSVKTIRKQTTKCTHTCCKLLWNSGCSESGILSDKAQRSTQLWLWSEHPCGFGEAELIYTSCTQRFTAGGVLVGKKHCIGIVQMCTWAHRPQPRWLYADTLREFRI